MAIEYGYRHASGDYVWGAGGFTRAQAEAMCKGYGYTLIAREVSEPWVVSIRD